MASDINEQTREELANMFEDFSKMPECAERILIKLIYDLSTDEHLDLEQLQNNEIRILEDRLKAEDIFYENAEKFEVLKGKLKSRKLE